MANDVSYFKVQGDATQYSFNDADLSQALRDEIYRAQASEQNITDDIAAETTRAEAAEGDLSTLTTTATDSLVSAINEVDGAVDTINTNMVYNPGDSINIRNVYAGFLQSASGGLQVYFTIPLNKACAANVTGATITGSMTVRTPTGNSTVSLTAHAVENVAVPTGVTVAYTGITVGSAGQPAAVWFGGGSKLTFT
jgi:hypothetical protein